MNTIYLIGLSLLHPEYGWMVAGGLAVTLAVLKGSQI